MIHLFEQDPRYKIDPTFEENHGSFSVINFGLNNALKKINSYSDADQAEWVGNASSLDLNFNYKDKKSFVITVWETINTLTYYHIMTAKKLTDETKKPIFGMSDQITNLYLKYGIPCRTLTCGCDTDFYHQTKPKNQKFTFLHINSSNIRSGLDMTLKAFSNAFQNNPNVQLIVKDTNENPILLQRINEFKQKGADITYITSRWTKSQVRDLYSESHVCLNLYRISSWGFPLAECSACNCLSLTGDFSPANELNTNEYAVLLKPNGIVDINKHIDYFTNYWGFLNCYPNFPYPEEPLFYNFDINEYTEKLKEIYTSWDSKYEKIDKRTPIVNKFKWENTAKQLTQYLYEKI
jgi:hypothetical protein